MISAFAQRTFQDQRIPGRGRRPGSIALRLRRNAAQAREAGHLPALGNGPQLGRTVVRQPDLLPVGKFRVLGALEPQRDGLGDRFGRRALLQQRFRRHVGKQDLIEIDMPPAAGMLVDDFDDGILAFQVGDIPTGRFERLDVLAHGGANDLAVDLQVDARLAGMVAAADQETDVTPFDAEGLRGGLALGSVARDKRVHQAAAGEAADRLLACFGSARRLFAKRLARQRPAFVGLLLEVLEQRGE